jgi:F0F1-type ATP synthase membrane subunit b/b'
MITTGEILSSIFRLLNFGIIVSLLVYVIKNKLLPTIRTKIEAQENHNRELVQEQARLQAAYEQSVIVLEQQHAEVSRLKKRIDLWAAVVQQKKIQRQEESNKQREYIQKKNEIRAYHKNLEITYTRISKDAIAAVESKIRQELIKQNGQTYFEHLIHSLHENN